MTHVNSIKVNDVGVILERTLVQSDGVTAFPVDTATVIRLDLLYPDETVASFTSELSTDGLDGAVRYVTEEGDLDQEGHYVGQFYIEIDGAKLHSDRFHFDVEATIV